eukprot:g15071.t1
MAAINDTVWGTELQCLNAVCEIVPQWMCYQRWVEWPLNEDTSSNGVLDLQSTVFNEATVAPARVGLSGEIVPGYLQLNKTQEQFLVSDVLDLETENATLEAWIKLGEVEDRIPGILQLQASLWLDLDGFQNGGAAGCPNELVVVIFWKEPAADYSVSVSLDNETWWTIIDVVGNRDRRVGRVVPRPTRDTYSYHQAFFGAHYLRLDMTRAAATRGPGIDQGKPVYSIYELEVQRDTNVARLQQTTIYNFFHK